MNKYNPKEIEPKWQKFWDTNKTFEVTEDSKKEKFYPLIEFPYPSGAGLHVGHPRPFTAMDVVARKRRMEGYNVLYPIGFDAFGLPTENYAIKTGRPPAEITAENIANFTRQLKSLGYSFDWSRVVDTSDPKYYKWTQWQFLQFFKHGLAYKKNQPINWCPKDKIGLANEEVVGGCCERCGTPVEKRNKEQWMLAITKYADKLLEGLKEVDYINAARVQQENWIGKSEGAEIIFDLNVPGQDKGKHKVTVFTTRPDTLFGATFLAISTELASKWMNVGWQASEEVKKYVAATLEEQKKANNREEEPEKTGVDSGVVAINPANGGEIPVWITNYVLPGYGTGAIMAVPAHDERDWEFAKKYNLRIKEVVSGGNVHEAAFTDNGKAVQSDFLNGLDTKAAKEKMIAWVEEKKIGSKKVNYKLRDWVFSRQRYWGEPIPLVHCESCAKKKQKVLLIHGFGGYDTENWFPWFKEALEKIGYEVIIPNLPDTNVPDLEKWVGTLMEIPFAENDEPIVIAHSLGGPTAVEFVARKGIRIKKLILVAPTGNTANLDHLKKYDFTDADISIIQDFGKSLKNLSKVKKLVSDSLLIFSKDDPYIPLENVDNYKVLGGREVFFENKQHFNQRWGHTMFPEILKEFPVEMNSGWIPLPESELPLTLPKVAKYEPTDNGESPLSTMTDWVNTTCPKCGGPAKRETDIMPNWAGSSWYFLRYADPHNDTEFVAMDKLQFWNPVDWYNGGMEHTVLHLLYSRFWNQFLYDIGLVPTSEPYKKRTSHGLIMGPDGEKMSKSRGNVINPDEMVDKFGADALRAYIMFMGPFDQHVAWDTNGLVGVRRFIERVWSLQEKVVKDANSTTINSVLHQTIKKVGDDIEKMSFNTAISALMSLSNDLMKEEKISVEAYQSIVKLVSPFCPHVAEELWSIVGDGKDLSLSMWPKFNAELAKESTLTIAVQVNGKVRDELQVNADISEDEIKKLVLASEKIQKWLDGKMPKKIIYIKEKLVSIVV